MPKSDYLMGAGYHQDIIYIIGGASPGASLIEYNTTDNTFTYTSSFFPVNLQGYGQFYHQIGTNLYMAGVSSGSITLFTVDTKQFTSSWNTAPASKTHPCLTGTDALLYYIGGRGTPQIQILNITNASWSDGPNMNQEREAFACVTTTNNKIYSNGGRDNDLDIHRNTVEYISTINIHSNSWSFTSNTLSMGLTNARSIVHAEVLVANANDLLDTVIELDTVSIMCTLFVGVPA